MTKHCNITLATCNTTITFYNLVNYQFKKKKTAGQIRQINFMRREEQKPVVLFLIALKKLCENLMF